MGLLFIHYYDAPLRFFRGLSYYFFCAADCLEHRFSLACEFAEKLCSYLSISFAAELDITQVVFFNNGMAADNSIVDYIDIPRLVEMGMGISLYLLSTSCPASMTNSYMTFDNFLADFLD